VRVWILMIAALTACEGSSTDDLGPSDPGQTWPATDTAVDTDTGTAVWELSGFSWVVDGALAGMPLPYDEHLPWIADQGVDLLFSLTEEPLDPDAVAAQGMDPHHIPIEDFTAPTQDQIDEFTQLTADRIGQGSQVGVHCHGGLGRTGTMLATWFVRDGMTADDAMAHVRELRPGSIETEEQEDAVRTYEERLRPE